MSDQLTRIEAKIDRMNSKIDGLCESRASQGAKVDGHATQLALIWTAIFLIAGSAVAAWFKL